MKQNEAYIMRFPKAKEKPYPVFELARFSASRSQTG